MTTIKKPLSIKEKREAAAAVMQKIQAEARSATQGSFKPAPRVVPKNPETLRKGRKPGGARKNLNSTHYTYEVEVFESTKTESLTGLLELEKFGLSSLPSSTGTSRAIGAQDIQNYVRPGMTKFFVDDDGRILKVMRVK